ncbi:glycoside hydrolase superfamily [Mycena albidolilacea]|uniref:Glycoside hydrolase superfamily n=1 Tax=Mycena albidolilacea TaxID=1033008 RepID=A0AAD7ALW2_9AGAR|nr:glycoside hydrolase superfamily [Mycena albidolilacea]
MRVHPVLVSSLFPAILPLFSNAQDIPTNATSLPLGSCAPDIPCSNGACCNGASGFCGFGDDFCGAGVCTSNCNAQAECGKDAPPQNTTCPLNVCCSKFGFCGTTEEFCSEGCQSGCDAPPIPSCGTNQQSALNRRIGYYEAWAANRGCMAYSPEKISAETLTHINFAFALISNSFNVVAMAAGDTDLWKRTTALKSRNPTLKVYLSIGGWTFNDPPTSRIFSEMVASDANTQTFVSSVLHVFESYGFDGLNVDWEYPAANDRGGVPEDTKNYVTFMAKVKKAFSGPGYGLTFTAPSSYWYLQHFDLPGLLESADWVNVMTYDLHGFWDGKDIWIGPIVAAHTNLTEIDEAFKLYWRVGVQSSQMVMGFGFYGRSFTLASGDCPDPGCIWASGGNAGPCSGQSGILMYNEIQTILDRTVDKCDGNAPNSVSCASAGSSPAVTLPVFDEEAAVKYIRWDDNQWVSYDDADSFAVKMNYANDHCIGGSMIWSMDQDDDSYSAIKGLYPDIDAAAGGLTEKNDKCIISGCDVSSCGPGYNKMGVTQEDPLSPGDRCDRLICCPTNNSPSSCSWRGGDTTPCNPICKPGEQALTTQTCESGGTQAFCCTTDNKVTD